MGTDNALSRHRGGRSPQCGGCRDSVHPPLGAGGWEAPSSATRRAEVGLLSGPVGS